LKNEFFNKETVTAFGYRNKWEQVRQAFAGTLPSIPEFREEYETLLNDKSYQTQEIAFI
jgi:aminopeptidase N